MKNNPVLVVIIVICFIFGLYSLFQKNNNTVDLVIPVIPVVPDQPTPSPEPEKEITIYVFKAVWCEPCKRMAPYWNSTEVQNIIKENKYRLEFVDSDEDKEKVKLYKVTAVPTIVVCKESEIKRNIGYLTKSKLVEFLKSIKE